MTLAGIPGTILADWLEFRKPNELKFCANHSDHDSLLAGGSTTKFQRSLSSRESLPLDLTCFD